MAIAENSNEFMLNATNLAGNQTKPVIAKLTGGGFVAAWDSALFGDPNKTDVKFQIFNSSGIAVGAVQTASAQPQNDERVQDIIANPNGGFSIAYISGNTAGPAPTGYGATGTMNTIGVVRNFAANGTALGSEGALFSIGAEELVTSIKLVDVSATTIRAYYTQRDSATLSGSLFKSSDIPIANAAGVTSTLVKDYDGVPNAIPTIELKVADASRQSAASDLIVMTPRFLFSDSAATEATTNGLASLTNIGNGFFLGLIQTGVGVGPTINIYSGTGANAAALEISGSAGAGVAGATNGSISQVETNALGGGRFILSWLYDSPTTGEDGVYGVVFNANTMSVEFSPTRLIDRLVTSYDLEVLSDGRFVVVASAQSQLTGADIVAKTFDAQDASFSTPTAFGIFSNANFRAISFVNDSAGLRFDASAPETNTGAATDVAAGYAGIIGGAGADTLLGDFQNNIIKGGAGNDVIDGRTGFDNLFGGDGDDTLIGGTGGDKLDGGIGNDTLSGGADGDIIEGGAGNDRLNGGDAPDTLKGGVGNDVIFGGSSDDQIFGDAGNDSIQGNDGNDTLFGGDNNDVLSGGNGNDTMDGGLGNDRFATGNGEDVVNGGGGIDTISYSGFVLTAAPGQSIVAGFLIDLDGGNDVDLGGTAGLGIDLTLGPKDSLNNIENAVGSNGNDYIVGNAATNVLTGGAGNDILRGGVGADELIGGTGADSFRFESASEGTDIIRAFEGSIDKIQIQSSAFGDTDQSNIVSRFVANATGTATIAGPQFTFDNAGVGVGVLSFDADGTGAGAAQVVATIQFQIPTGFTVFGAADFAFF